MRTFGTHLVALLVTLAAVHGQTSQSRAIEHLRAGQDALQLERWEVAEREFKAAIGLDPLLELAHYGLGQTYMATKRYVEAVRAFLSTRDAFHRGAADQLVDSLEGEQRLQDQIRTLHDQRRALQSGRYRTPNLQSTLNRLDDQIRQLETARGRTRDGSAPPTPPYISVALGSAYFRTSAFADAEREWRAALKVDPNIGEVHNNLAVVLMLTGRFEEAEREVRLAEKAGFKVSDAFKADLKAAKAKGKG